MTMKLDILVVDDEPSISQVVSLVLSEDGHHVDVAGSGEEALELFAKGDYSLLISDIVMPGMSGIDLLKKIKQISADTQVIIMTSHAELKTAIEALRSNAYDYLIKPFDDINVISMVTLRAVEKVNLIRENRILLEELKMKNEEATRMNAALRELAMQDGLTGLFNHRHFYELLATEVERSKRYNHVFSVLLMSVDHFMKYNDTHGQTAGDKVLYTIAELFKKNTRKSNVAARYGFETFAVILPEISWEEAIAFAERIRVLVAEYPFAGRENLPGGSVTISFGAATFPHDGIDRKALIDHADQALVKAKSSGIKKGC
ncbi:MAG: diguanylate cyclase [Nitrospirae bacterium]|nr:diguanylate cyclase [Nitrospirota bacterium]